MNHVCVSVYLDKILLLLY